MSQYSGKYPKSNARLIRYTKKIVEIIKPRFFFFLGFWSLSQPDPSSGECVDVTVTDEQQSWELQTCESLLPFLCRANACPTGQIVLHLD